MRVVARASRRSVSSPALALALAVVLAGAGGVALPGCADGGSGAARARYNQALADYEAGRWEEAAEGFLEARDQAGMDPELRFRAAYNLGLSHARRADELGAAGDGAAGSEAGPEASPEAIIDSLRQSAAWFRDAIRLDPESEDARVNLEVVLRRIQVLADQLNKGQNSLEARLERVIEDQRALRDQIRGLMQRVAESGAAAEPVAFQDEFDALATFERRLLADTGTVSDLAGEELGLLQGKDQRSQEEEMRLVQLQNLDIYLQAARGELADTRRRLRRLLGDEAHASAVAGLAALERAREQLLDPVTALRGIAQDQAQVLGQTVGLDQLGKGGVQIGAGDEAAQEAPPAPPVWLTAGYLQGRQDVLRQRTDEVLARFQAGVSAAGDEAAQADAPADPRTQRVLAQAAEAVPFLEQAVTHMQGAAGALAGEDLARAAEAQTDAIEALFRAMERFSDIRTLIELIHGEHMATSALLTPPDAAEAAALPPEIAGLSTAERSERIRALVTRNIDRLSRLEGLLDDELAVLDAQAQQAQAQQPQAGPQAQQLSPEQIEAAKQQYLQAQGLRAQAAEALARLDGAVGEGSAVRIDEARAAAGEATEHIEALRRLFFSIVEHLKELLQSQTRTHDQTASAAAGPVDELAGRLGQLVTPQTEHATTGDGLAQALAAQADAAAQAPQQPGSGADASERLAQAAEEVTQATAEMQSAADFLRKDAEAAQSMSVDIGPTLEAQQLAMEHLENAIRLLQPPQQQQQQDQQQQDQQQQDQQQQDQQQQQQQQAQEMSQQQAQRRLQEIRDREAERQREKRRRERFTPEPVEKDW